MRLLARYLLRECLVALAFCFCAFLILLVAGDLVSQLNSLQEKRLKGLEVAQFYLYRLPEFMTIVLPVSLLLALLYALTNHARHNEITAMRAAGISLWRIGMPYFAIATLCAGTLFFINEWIAPDAAEIAVAIKNQHAKEETGKNRQIRKNFVFSNAREGRTWHIGWYHRPTGTMRGVALEWRLSDGTTRSIFADRGRFTNGVWQLENVTEMRRAVGPDAVSVKSLTNQLTLPVISETPEVIRSEISVSEKLGDKLGARQADIPLQAIRDYLRLHPNPEPAIQAWLHTKLHGRIAAPVTCFVIVLLALPFAAASGRRNVFVGVASSIVIFFAYYISQQIGFAVAETGRIPAWLGAWLPNLLAAATGIWLLARTR